MPRKKPPGMAADPRNGERYALVQADGVPKCDLPEPLQTSGHPVVLHAWGKYWYDPVSAILQVSDMVIVQRYFTALDRYFKLSEEADKQPICTGSQGQDVLNPKYQAANMALTAAERLERQLGIGPSNRSKLGIELVAADRAAGPRQFERGEGEGPGGSITLVPQEDDPRERGRE